MAKNVDVTIRAKDETKAGFASAQKEAESFGSRVKDAINKPFELIKGLVAVEAVRWFGEFAKSAVEAAGENEAAWGRVEQAVANAGIGFAGVRKELNETFERMSKGTRYEATEVTSAFGELLNITNDYSGSVKNLRLVMDIAAAKQMDLQSAAMLVGRVMDGNTSMLKRYGIVLNDNADAMEQLRTRFSGFAERDGKTLEGRVHQLANAWQELKEKLGDALGNADLFTASSNHAVDALQRMSHWIDTNKENINDFASALGTIAGWLAKIAMYSFGEHGVGGVLGLIASGYARIGEAAGITYSAIRGAFTGYGIGEDTGPTSEQERALFRAHTHGHAATEAQIEANKRRVAEEAAKKAAQEAVKAANEHVDALKKEADLLVKKHDLIGLTLHDMERLNTIATELNKVAHDPNAPIARQIAALDGLKGLVPYSLASITAADKKRLGVQQTGTSNALPYASYSNIPQIGVSVGSSFRQGVGEEFAQAAGVADPMIKATKQFGDALHSLTGGAMADFFSAWQQGIEEIIAGHEKMGTVIPKVLKRAIGASLAADAQDTMLRAAKALALGLTDPSGIHFAQAARLFAIGTAESAAAAALMSSGSGGGGYGGGVSPGGFSSAQSTAPGSGKVNVILRGKGINFKNPDDLTALAEALKELGETRELNFIVEDAA